MSIIKHITTAAALFSFAAIPLSGQQDAIRKADDLFAAYRFSEAAGLYRRVASSAADSDMVFQMEQNILLCENGENFIRYVSTPNVVSRKNVPLAEMPLWLPDIAGGWASIPNPLDSAVNRYQHHTFFPSGSDRIIYAAVSPYGNWDIYEVTRESDTQWSAPEPLVEFNTSGNEIFPVLSSDGRTIWFASDGQPGIGGYDLFVSRWDDAEGKWGIPDNMGIPFSSTGDDILYFDTPDGNWSVLVSGRDAAGGTATIYVLELDSNPVKTSVSDISRIQEIARLDINAPSGGSTPAPAAKKADGQTDEYTAVVLKLRSVQKSYQDILSRLEKNRDDYENAANKTEKDRLAEEIRKLENNAVLTKAQLDATEEDVRKAEKELLKKGIIPPMVDMPEDKPQAGPAKYEFAKSEEIPAPAMVTRIPEPVFDYTFRIQEESEAAPEGPLPNGIIYQVQLVTLGAKPDDMKRFKGITPIFFSKTSAGTCACRAGVFRTYNEVSKAVQKVKSKGFPQAFAVASKDGKTISIKSARLQENASGGASYNVIIKGYQEGLPSNVKTAISANCTKDLAKSTEDGKTVYIIGPFKSQSEAESLVSALDAAGAEGVSFEEVSK